MTSDCLVWPSTVSIIRWVFNHTGQYMWQGVWCGIDSTGIRVSKLWVKFWPGHIGGMQHWALNTLSMTFPCLWKGVRMYTLQTKRAKCDYTCTIPFTVTRLVFNNCSNKYMVVFISPLRNEEWRFVLLRWLLRAQSLNSSSFPSLTYFQVRELFGILPISTGICLNTNAQLSIAFHMWHLLFPFESHAPPDKYP